MKVCLLTHGYPLFTANTTAPFIESIAETLQEQRVNVTVAYARHPSVSAHSGGS